MTKHDIHSFKITKKLKLILIGMLLGDANLQTFSKGKTVRLRVLHSIKQKEYLQHKYLLFQNICRTKISFLEEKRENKLYQKCYFQTLTTSKFAFFFHMFYKDGQKCLPKLIHRYLEPITLAYWYMDDGSMKWKNRSKAVRLCTDNFTFQEVQVLRDLLNEKYDLKATIFKQRSRFRIYIPNTNLEFTHLIQEYVIEEMKWKLPKAS